MNTKEFKANIPFYMQLQYFFFYLFNFEIFPLLVGLSLVFIFFPIAIYLFIILNLLVTMMAYKLAFDVLKGAAYGEQCPKVMQNSVVSNGVAVKVLVVALVQTGVEILLQELGVSSSKIQWVNTVLIFVTPAIYMYLAMTNSLIQALNPVSLVRLILKFPVNYILIVIFWLVSQYFVANLLPQLIFFVPALIAGMLMLFFEFGFLIMTFHIMGFVLFQNRRLIGMTEDDSMDEVRKDNPMYLRIKRLAKSGEFEEALQILHELKLAGDGSDEILEIENNLLNVFDQHKDSVLSAESVIHQMLLSGKTHSAFSKVTEILERTRNFDAYEVTDYFQLAKYAYDHKRYLIASKIIDQFNIRNSKHPEAVKIGYLKAHIMFKNKEPKAHIKGVLKGLIKNFPDHPQIQKVQSWLLGLDK